MAESSTSPASSSVAGSPAHRSLRILYADDLLELRKVAQISLSREGHGVECCENGDLALARIVQDPAYDLVITDHHMPNMSGLELVAKLRERSYGGKIMVFSSELSEEVAAQYREQKVDRILYKPVIPSTLRKTLNELFPPSASAA